MECKRLIVNAQEGESFLPAYLCEMLNMGQLVVYGGIEEDELCAVAAFSALPGQKSECSLEYIQVPQKKRFLGLAHALLDYCFQLFAENGIRSVTCKRIGTIQELSCDYDFLVKEHFLPLQFQGHLLHYYVQDMKTSRLAEQVMTKKEQLLQVEQLAQDDWKLKKFINSGAEPAGRYGDMKYSRFYVKDGEIAGAVFAERIDERTLCICGCYAAPVENPPYVWASLLAAVVEMAYTELPEDGQMILQIFDEKLYGMLCRLIGQGEENLLIQEYVRRVYIGRERNA